MDEAVLVVNPISGSSRRRNAVERYVTALEGHGMSVRIHPTRAAGDGARAARRAADEGAPVVIAAGGDGTVNDVAAGLLAEEGASTALAVLPLGTSNLAARHLGIARRRPEDAAEAVWGGRAVEIDVGALGDRTFVACAGIGLDANIVAELAARRRGHIGYLSYTVPMWRTATRYAMPELTAEDDAGATHVGTQVVVLNMRPYASFLEPAPQASATDGLLDVVVLAGRGTLRVLRWSLAAMRSRLLESPDAVHLRCRRLRVTSEFPIPVQIDGDVGGTTPVDILVRPRALRVLCPVPRADRRAR